MPSIQSVIDTILAQIPEPLTEDTVDTIKAGDPVFLQKRAFIEQHHLVIWRFHDNLHGHRPDPTMAGISQAMGWQGYQDEEQGFFMIPEKTRT